MKGKKRFLFFAFVCVLFSGSGAADLIIFNSNIQVGIIIKMLYRNAFGKPLEEHPPFPCDVNKNCNVVRTQYNSRELYPSPYRWRRVVLFENTMRPEVTGLRHIGTINQNIVSGHIDTVLNVNQAFNIKKTLSTGADKAFSAANLMFSIQKK